jgi:hypothetical protein
MNSQVSSLVNNVVKLCGIRITKRVGLAAGVTDHLLAKEHQNLLFDSKDQERQLSLNMVQENIEENLAYLIDSLTLLDPGNELHDWILGHPLSPGEEVEVPSCIKGDITAASANYYTVLSLVTYSMGLTLLVFLTQHRNLEIGCTDTTCSFAL